MKNREILLDRIKRKIGKKFDLEKYPLTMHLRADNVLVLTGELPSWELADEIAHLAGKNKNLRNVINEIEVGGKSLAFKADESRIKAGRKLGLLDEADIIIVGGGIIGCGIARELAKYDLQIVVLEKGDDVASGASKANNGMIHPGNAVTPGSLKAKLNVEGNSLYSRWAKELNSNFERSGSFVVSYQKKDKKMIWLAWLAGRLNKVPGMRFISVSEFEKMEPTVALKPKKVLFTPSTAYVDGFEVTIALAENAASNGVRFHLNTEVLAVEKENSQISAVVTSQGIVKGKLLINAAGIYADEIAAMAGDQFYTLHPRKGSIIIFDKAAQGVSRALNGLPEIRAKNTKGGGLQCTVAGNPLWGPNAVEIMDKDDLSVQRSDLEYALVSGEKINPQVRREDIISYFAGIRAADYKEDFIIEPSEIVPGFIHVAGIQSPGLAAAPAIAKLVEELVKKEIKDLKQKQDWQPFREKKIVFSELSSARQDQLIKDNPAYGKIVCRCESITEAEIIEALNSKLAVFSVDALKRRVRVTGGRCQGGFCLPKILAIIAEEKGLDIKEIKKQGEQSQIIKAEIRPELSAVSEAVNEKN